MHVTVINIQDPGALALISWSRKNRSFAKEIHVLLVPCAFFCFKKLSAFLFSLRINATHLNTFTSFASQLCIGDRWLTVPSVCFSVWVSDWIYRQMSSHCFRFTDLVSEYLRIFQWVEPSIILICEFGNI